MNMRKKFILSVCITLLAACTNPIIDASTPESMEYSAAKIVSSLPDKDKESFHQAYSSIVFSYRSHVAFVEEGDTRDVIEKRLRQKIDGLNSRQILEEYEKVKKKSALWSIKIIERDIEKAKNDRDQINLVTIDQYKLYMGKDGVLDRMYMDLTVHNGSIYNLKDFLFSIRLGSSTKDTLLPQKMDIYVHISEGLEAGGRSGKQIDLGEPSYQMYFPENPVVSEYSTVRITGNDVDINSNIYPSLPELEKRLVLAKVKFEEDFGAE